MQRLKLGQNLAKLGQGLGEVKGGGAEGLPQVLPAKECGKPGQGRVCGQLREGQGGLGPVKGERSPYGFGGQVGR